MPRSIRISNAISRFSVLLGKSCGVFYLAAIVLSVYEVFMRYALDAPTAWTNEIIMALCATAWMLCVGAMTRQKRHITLTVMALLVGPVAWRRMARTALVLSMIGVAALLYACWHPMMAAVSSMQRSGSAFNPPTPMFLKTMLVVACVLYLLQLIANLMASGTKTDHDHSGQL